MQPIPPMSVKGGRVVLATHSDRQGLYLKLAGAAVLLATGLGGYWLGQSGQASPTAAKTGTPASSPQETAAATSTATTASLQSAVADALKESTLASDNEKRFVQAQQAYLQQAPETPAEVKARLDRLAANPQALEAHNRNVLNRVSAPANIQGPAAEIDRAVEASQRAASASAADPMKSALKSEAQTREAEGRTYVVQAGDTLWSIAGRVYGDPYQFQRLFEANPRVLTSPNHIFPGQVLRVPA